MYRFALLALAAGSVVDPVRQPFDVASALFLESMSAGSEERLRLFLSDPIDLSSCDGLSRRYNIGCSAWKGEAKLLKKPWPGSCGSRSSGRPERILRIEAVDRHLRLAIIGWLHALNEETNDRDMFMKSLRLVVFDHLETAQVVAKRFKDERFQRALRISDLSRTKSLIRSFIDRKLFNDTLADIAELRFEVSEILARLTDAIEAVLSAEYK